MPPFPLPLYPTSQTHGSSRHRRCLSPVQNISSTTAVVKSNNSDLNSSSSSSSKKHQWECAEKSAITRVDNLSENMEILRADADCTAIPTYNNKINFKSDVVTSSNVAAQAQKTHASISNSDLTSVHKLKTKNSKMMNTSPLIISPASLAKSEESLFNIKPRSVKMRAPLPLCSNEHNDDNDGDDNNIGSNANKQHKVHQNTIHEKDVVVDDGNNENEDDDVVFTDVQCTEQEDRNNLVFEYNNNYNDDNTNNIIINNGVITEELLRDWTGWEDLPLVLTAEFYLDASQWMNMDVLSSLLPMLNSLKLNRSFLPSIRVLGNGFQHLRYLWLNSCQLSDLHGISACAPHLIELYVAFNHITNLTPLLDIAETLSVLDVEGNELTNVHELAFVLGALGKVTSINLQGNPVEFDVAIAELLEARKQEMKFIEEYEQESAVSQQEQLEQEIQKASESNIQSINSIHDKHNNALENGTHAKDVTTQKETINKTKNLFFEQLQEEEEEIATIDGGVVCNSRVVLFRQWIHMIMPQLHYLDDIPLPSIHSPTSPVQHEEYEEEEEQSGEHDASHHNDSHEHHHHDTRKHHKHRHHKSKNMNNNNNNNKDDDDNDNFNEDEPTSNIMDTSSKLKSKKKKKSHNGLQSTNTTYDITSGNGDGGDEGNSHRTLCKEEIKGHQNENKNNKNTNTNKNVNKQSSLSRLYSDPLDEALADELELVQACIRECKFDILDAAIEARHKTLYSRPSTSCCGARPRKLSAYNNNINNINSSSMSNLEHASYNFNNSKHTLVHTASSVNITGRLNNFCSTYDKNKNNNNNKTASYVEATNTNSWAKAHDTEATPVSRLTTGDVLAGSAIASLRKRLAEYKPVESNSTNTSSSLTNIIISNNNIKNVNTKNENVNDSKANNTNVHDTEIDAARWDVEEVNNNEKELKECEERRNDDEFDENVEDEWDYYKAKLTRQSSASARPFFAFRERMLFKSGNTNTNNKNEKKELQECNVDYVIAAQNTNADKDTHQNKRGNSSSSGNECKYDNDYMCNSMTYDEVSCRETISAPSTTPNSVAGTLCTSYTANSTWRMGTPSESPYSYMANSIKSRNNNNNNDINMLFELHEVSNHEIQTNNCTNNSHSSISKHHHNHHFYYFSDSSNSDTQTSNQSHDDFNEFVKRQVQQTRAQIALAGEQQEMEVDNYDDIGSREVNRSVVLCESAKRKHKKKSSKSKHHINEDSSNNNTKGNHVLSSGFLSEQGEFEVITLDDIP